jgi:hypothetical protein
MARTTHPPRAHSGSSERKTVGVYDRPPQKRNLKPIFIALVIVLAVVLTLLFVRLSHGSQAAEGTWGERAAQVNVPDFHLALNEAILFLQRSENR